MLALLQATTLSATGAHARPLCLNLYPLPAKLQIPISYESDTPLAVLAVPSATISQISSLAPPASKLAPI